ncbi:uncharacterized [Tachysurus ichikawai]
METTRMPSCVHSPAVFTLTLTQPNFASVTDGDFPLVVTVGSRLKLGIALYTSRGMLLRERNVCESSGECGSALLKALGQGLAFVL